MVPKPNVNYDGPYYIAPRRPKGERVESIPLTALRPGPSPRATKIHGAHVESLAEVYDQLPPILVHRASIGVIDGAHRVEAARRSGRTSIGVVWFEGGLGEARAAAIKANISHGLPLTRAERKQAALDLLRELPEKSDRWVAEICGLSHTTIGALRHSAMPSLSVDQSPVRVGRDGRRRRTGTPATRSKSVSALAAHPPATIREIADQAGRVPATAKRVREDGSEETGLGMRQEVEATNPLAHWLRTIGAVTERMSERCIIDADCSEFMDRIPLGHIYEVADECKHRAKNWNIVAAALENRAREHTRRHR